MENKANLLKVSQSINQSINQSKKKRKKEKSCSEMRSTVEDIASCCEN
jgi:hypothetical protein